MLRPINQEYLKDVAYNLLTESIVLKLEGYDAEVEEIQEDIDYLSELEYHYAEEVQN